MKNFYIWRKMLNISHARVSKKKTLVCIEPYRVPIWPEPVSEVENITCLCSKRRRSAPLEMVFYRKL